MSRWSSGRNILAGAGLGQLDDGDVTQVGVAAEADEALERAELPVHGVLPAVVLHHGEAHRELVVEGAGEVVLPHSHHQRVQGAHPAAVGGHHPQVVGVDILLGGQCKDLLGAVQVILLAYSNKLIF